MYAYAYAYMDGAERGVKGGYMHEHERKGRKELEGMDIENETVCIERASVRIPCQTVSNMYNVYPYTCIRVLN